MIVDSHVHVCPDKIAAASAKVFKERNNWEWVYDGTVGTLFKQMEKNNISKAIVCNTVVRGDFISKANDFVASQVKEFPGKLYGYTFIHPGNADPAGELERCATMYGFKAVKINGSLNKFFPEDENMMAVYERAIKFDVTIMTHTGPNVENFFKDPSEIKERQFAEPKSWTRVLQKYPKLRLVLAHFAGSTHYYKDAIEIMESYPHVYTDCSMVLNKLTPTDATNFIKKVGVDRVLFGTDYPGHEIVHEIDLVKALGLSDEEKDKVLFKNAIRFYGMES